MCHVSKSSPMEEEKQYWLRMQELNTKHTVETFKMIVKKGLCSLVREVFEQTETYE